MFEDKLNVKFTTELLCTKDPAIFLGVARILKVPFMTEEGTPKDFNEIVDNVIGAYCASPHKRKKELLKILQDANKCKESVLDAGNTQDSAKTVSDEEV